MHMLGHIITVTIVKTLFKNCDHATMHKPAHI